MQRCILERIQRPGRVTSAEHRELGEWVEQRAAAMERLMGVSPASVAAVALSAEDAARVKAAVGRGARLEGSTEVGGVLTVVEVDDFEGRRAWREYWVSTGTERLKVHPVTPEQLPAC